MNTPFWIAVIIAALGLGIAIGSVLNEVEAWEMGWGMAVSRIAGAIVFFCGLFVALCLRG